MKIAVIAVVLGTLIAVVRGADPAALRLVPFPKEVQLGEGAFNLNRPLSLDVPVDAAAIGGILADEFRRAGMPEPKLTITDSNRHFWCLYAGQRPAKLPDLPKPREPGGDEDHELAVTPDVVVAAARRPAGMLHAAQTLAQLIRANRADDAIPCLAIRDWPALRWRAFQDDMTRGPSSTLQTLEAQARLGALLKLNLMTYYMEYQYAFSKHPEIGPKDGSLTPEELKKLVEFARPLGVDILGNQQSFGHFERILKHERYAALRENASVLTPVKDETYQLLDDLYSEVIPILPFEFFNVCCDETWGLGAGPSKEVAQKVGVGRVYVNHIRRVHDLVQGKYKKRMMMWGDIILKHPNDLELIPKDTIMLTWGYGPRASFEDQILPFARSGYEFFVCPGVSNWNNILPNFRAANVNIQNFVRDGIKHGAIGMLNTDWLDDGEGLKGHKWHGMAWGAECAWNGSKTSIEDFNRRIGAVLFAEKGDEFGQAVALLSAPEVSGMPNRRFWEKDFPPRAGAQRESAEKLLAIVRPARAHLEACRKAATANQWVLDDYLFGARRMELVGQRILDGLEAAKAASDAQSAAPEEAARLLAHAQQWAELHRDYQAVLGRDFSKLWMSQSKPYALDWTTKRYEASMQYYDALAKKIGEAKQAVRAGKRPPSPKEMGLAAPEK